MDERARRAEVAAAIPWFHSIDLGHDVTTPGTKPPDVLERELAFLALPDLAGRTVLDIGAWDGYFAFAAERLGASRVVALDHYAWALDIDASREYIARCVRDGTVARAFEEVDGVWRPDALPGRAGFDAARGFLGSRVEPVFGDFMTVDLAGLGAFDVVLFLGVLYHLLDPFLALRRLRELTRELAVVETVCVVVPGREHHALWEFFETTELNGDPTNWWAPNRAGLEAACRAAGFRHVESLAYPLPDSPPAGHEWHYGRAVVQLRP